MAKSAKKVVAKKSVKPAAKKVVAKKASVKASPRRTWDDGVKIKVVKDFNAHEGSAAYKLFAAVKKAKTVGDARKFTARLPRHEMLIPYLRFWAKRGELKVSA